MANTDRRLRRKVRSSYIISTVSIALVLFLLGAVAYLMTAAIRIADSLQQSVTIIVELRNDAGELLPQSPLVSSLAAGNSAAHDRIAAYSRSAG